ncbi:MAG TPA: thiol-disulfide isomerase [Terriglobales bacterium]
MRSERVSLVLLLVCAQALAATPPTFYRDVSPILAQHCESCHRSGEIAPFPLVTYRDAKPWAKLIGRSVESRKMPPWFADPCCGHFANDPSLSNTEIATIVDWVNSGAPAGDAKDALPAPPWTKGWNIKPPDLVLKMPVTVKLPAEGDIEYTYEIVPTNFAQGKWVKMSELRPSARDHVHHAVVYIRPPESNWLRKAPVGVPFTASSLHDPHLMHEAHSTTSDLLLVYAPGSSPENWPDGMAKFIPAHSDLVFQMHYTTNGKPAHDQTALGLVFAGRAPAQRVLTLQLANDDDTIPIPPNTDNYRVEVSGTLPNDCTLLSFFPHMHLRGKRFEYNIVHPDGSRETLLRVNYDFYWQLSYRLAEPRFLKAGTKLEAVAWYDNSRKNLHNPDPESPVKWGEQTYNEMMVGFFDVAVPAGMDKEQFFVRRP